jgi:hypothetical protein
MIKIANKLNIGIKYKVREYIFNLIYIKDDDNDKRYEYHGIYIKNK